jgi:hypothetical protein
MHVRAQRPARRRITISFDESGTMSEDRIGELSVPESVRVREVVGVAHTREQLDLIVERLLGAGFDRQDIDLMASWDAVRDKLGIPYPDPRLVADAPDVPRRDVVTDDDVAASTALIFGTLMSIGALGAAVPIIASGGAIAAAITAAALGGAAATELAEIIRDRIIRRSDADHLENDLRLGGLVVFVRVRNPEQEAQALAVLRSCDASNVHVHEVDLRKALDDAPLAKIMRDPLLDSDDPDP